MPSRRPEYARVVGYLTTRGDVRARGLPARRSSSTGTHGYQFVESHRWMGELGVRYLLGVDGISLFMVALTALLFPIGLLASAQDRAARRRSRSGCSLLEAAVIGVFLALDLVLFFVALRVRARADVLPHRGLGPRQQALRGDEVLPLHDGRFRVPVRRRCCRVAFLYQHAPGTRSRSTSARSPSGRRRTGNISIGDRASGCSSRSAIGVRGEGAAVPVPHVAARRAHRGADRGFGRAGRRAAQDGHLRVPALRDPDVPAGRGRPRADPARARR